MVACAKDPEELPQIFCGCMLPDSTVSLHLSRLMAVDLIQYPLPPFPHTHARTFSHTHYHGSDRLNWLKTPMAKYHAGHGMGIMTYYASCSRCNWLKYLLPHF